MTTSKYKQWTPELPAPGEDPLSENVARQEDRDVLRDPEVGTEGETIRIFSGRQAEPRPVEIEQTPFDPNPPSVTEVRQRHHLEPAPPSTDPLSDDQLNRRESVPGHSGIYRRFDARGRERFEIDYLDPAGNRRTQQVKGGIDEAEDDLSERLDVLGGSAVPDA